MEKWLALLHYNPLSYLETTENRAIRYFCRKDLFEKEGWEEELYDLPVVQQIIRHQQKEGWWKFQNPTSSLINYNLLETYRNLGFLIEKYGLTKQHETIQKAARYCFSCQTKEGDIRGFYGNQYSPNYTAATLELLIKAGYIDNPNVSKGLDWLLSFRLNDGGWAIAQRTLNKKWLMNYN